MLVRADPCRAWAARAGVRGPRGRRRRERPQRRLCPPRRCDGVRPRAGGAGRRASAAPLAVHGAVAGATRGARRGRVSSCWQPSPGGWARRASRARTRARSPPRGWVRRRMARRTSCAAGPAVLAVPSSIRATGRSTPSAGSAGWRGTRSRPAPRSSSTHGSIPGSSTRGVIVIAVDGLIGAVAPELEPASRRSGARCLPPSRSPSGSTSARTTLARGTTTGSSFRTAGSSSGASATRAWKPSGRPSRRRRCSYRSASKTSWPSCWAGDPRSRTAGPGSGARRPIGCRSSARSRAGNGCGSRAATRDTATSSGSPAATSSPAPFSATHRRARAVRPCPVSSRLGQVDARQIDQGIHLFECRDRDREVLDREPCRVEHGDLVVAPAPRGRRPPGPRRARSRRRDRGRPPRRRARARLRGLPAPSRHRRRGLGRARRKLPRPSRAVRAHQADVLPGPEPARLEHDLAARRHGDDEVGRQRVLARRSKTAPSSIAA